MAEPSEPAPCQRKGTAATFRQYWPLFVGHALCVGLLTLVNRLELPFARSLIDCDSPPALDAVAFSGSTTCGDRLHVIDGGLQLSSRAQSQEHFARLLALLITGACADGYGRRPVLALSSFFLAASVLLLLVASCASEREVSLQLFVVAQALQGAAPFSLIGPIMLNDVAYAPETDARSLFTVAELIGTAVGTGSTALGIGLQALEITDFAAVWSVVFACAVVNLAVVLFFTPETLRPKNVAPPQGVYATVFGQIGEFRQLLQGNRLVRVILCRNIFTKLSDTDSFIVSACMALYGYSLPEVVIRFVGLHFWILGWTSLSPRLIDKIGERRTFFWSRVWMQAVHVMATPAVPVACGGLWLLEYGSKVGYGIAALERSIWVRCLPASQSAKAMALFAILAELMSSAASWLYRSLFDARAATYLGRGLPFFAATASRMCAFTLFWLLVWPVYAKVADELQAERTLQGAAVGAAGESPATASRKKNA